MTGDQLRLSRLRESARGLLWKQTRLGLDLLREPFCVGCVAFVILYALFFPRTVAIADESGALGLAWLFTQGTTFADVASADMPDLFRAGNHLASKVSPLHALLLVPTVLAGWKAGFTLSAMWALLGAVVVRRLLVRRGADGRWAILYFLNPGLLFYSRTMMAAVPAATLVLVGIDALERPNPRRMAGAFALAAAGLLKPAILPLVVVLLVASLWQCGSRNTRQMVPLLVGGGLPLVAILLYNAHTVGVPWWNGYLATGFQYKFHLSYMPQQLPFIVVALMVAPPAGIMIFRKDTLWGWWWAVAAAVQVGELSTYYYRDGLAYGAPGWVPGLRFLVPLLALSTVPAAVWWAARMRAGYATLAAGAVIVACAIGFVLHDDYLRGIEQVRKALRVNTENDAIIVGGDELKKYISPVFGQRTLTDRPASDSRVPSGAGRPGWLAGLFLPGQQPFWMRERGAGAIIHEEIRTWIWTRDFYLRRLE